MASDPEASGEHAAEPGPLPVPPSRAAAPAALGTAGTYEVRPGDSLWSIARRRLGTEASAADIARFVDRLWSLNADVVRSGSPDVILTGEKLRLPRRAELTLEAGLHRAGSSRDRRLIDRRPRLLLASSRRIPASAVDDAIVAVLLRFADVHRIPQRDLRNDVSAVLRRVRRGERLRITVAGRDAADLVPIDEAPTWMAGARAHELITDAQADAGLPTELDEAFPDTTDQL